MHFQPVFQRPGKNIFLINTLKKIDANAIKNELIRREIKYILIRDDLTMNWYQHLEEDKQRIITEFFNHSTRRLFRHGGYSFYALPDPNRQISR